MSVGLFLIGGTGPRTRQRANCARGHVRLHVSSLLSLRRAWRDDSVVRRGADVGEVGSFGGDPRPQREPAVPAIRSSLGHVCGTLRRSRAQGSGLDHPTLSRATAAEPELEEDDGHQQNLSTASSRLKLDFIPLSDVL